jgi:predicted adenylyl cyclase CyaB
MPQNVEIKARVRDWLGLRQQVEAIADRGPEILHQEDVFFQVPSGRLKLRIFDRNSGELIGYQRDDAAGPKTSFYEIAPTDCPDKLHGALAAVLPILGRVVKRRTLFFKGRTRIHLDDVEGLGHFMELEVELKSGEKFDSGQIEAEEIMEQLGIQNSDLIQVAYIDLL